jgi:BMFP domain-containing protein YqiC
MLPRMRQDGQPLPKEATEARERAYSGKSRGIVREEDPMPQSGGTMFDDFSRLMSDAAEMAHGVRREAETIFKAQVERWLANMDLVTREEFEAVRDMAIAARDENERLAKRIAVVEAQLAGEEIPRGTSETL